MNGIKIDTTLNLATIGTIVAMLLSAAVGFIYMRYEDLRVIGAMSSKQELLSEKISSMSGLLNQLKTDDKIFRSEISTALTKLQTDLAVSNAIRSVRGGGK